MTSFVETFHVEDPVSRVQGLYIMTYTKLCKFSKQSTNLEREMIRFPINLISQFTAIIILFNIGYTRDKENSIHGYVFDKSTGEPIEDVNVYIANTTWGSSTNKEGYYRIRQIPQGIHELVVTSIGYDYETKSILLKEDSELKFNFRLKPVIYETETTLVEGSIPTEWLEDLEIFKYYFFGSSEFAEDCTIENKEVLDFSRPYDSIFEASALKPLVITNRALGYKIDCILISFTFNKTSNTYRWSIKPKFTELEPEDDNQLAEWKNNRFNAYEGSQYHFLRSFCSKSLPEEGFDIYRVVEAGQKILRGDWHTVLVDYDEYIETGLYFTETILRFEKFIHVVYNNNYVSWIGLNYTHITLDKFGYPQEDNSYMIFGEWAKHGIADLLPKNYDDKDQR